MRACGGRVGDTMLEHNITVAPLDRTIALGRYYKELIAFFSNSLRDRDAAADVVHESYARVLAMDEGVSIQEPRALLYRIGKNIVVDTARRLAVEGRALDLIAAAGHDNAPSVEWEVETRQQLDTLLGHLSVMPRKRREAFILVKVFGYSHAEAAEHLSSTVSAIEKHVVRGILDCAGISARLS